MDDLLNVVWRARKESDIQKILSYWIRDVIPLQCKENRETLAVLIIPWAKEIFRLTKKPFTLLYIKSIVDGLYSPPFHVMEKLGRGMYTMRILDSEVIDLSHHLNQSWDHMTPEQYWDVDAVYVSESNTQIPGFNDWVGNLCAELCDRGKTIITDYYSSRFKAVPGSTNRQPAKAKSSSQQNPPSPRRFRLGDLFTRKKSREDDDRPRGDVDTEENEIEYVPYLRGRFGSEGYYPFLLSSQSDVAENVVVNVDSRDPNLILKNVREVSFGDDETETETETETDMETTESSDNSIATAPPQHYFAAGVSNTRTLSANPAVMFGQRSRGEKQPSDEKLGEDGQRGVSYQRMVWQPSLVNGGSGSNSRNSNSAKTSAYVARDDLLTRKVIVPTGVTWSDGVPFLAIRTDKPGLIISLNGKMDENGGGNGGLISSGAHRLLLNCIRLRKRDLTSSLGFNRRGYRTSSAVQPVSQRSVSFSGADKEEKEVVRDQLSLIQEGNLLPSLGMEADDELPETQGDSDEDVDKDYDYYEDDGPATPPGMGSSSDFPAFGGFSRVAHQFADEDSDDILDGLDDFEFDEDDQFGVGGGPPGVARGFRPPTLFRLPAI